MDQLLLGVLALGDVTGHHDVAAHRRVVAQVGDAVLQPDPRPVLVKGADRRRSGHGGARGVGVDEGGAQSREVVGMDELAVHSELALLWRIPQDAVERWAGVLQVALGADHDDEVAHVLHERAEAALAGFDLFPGDGGLGDVVGQALDGDQLAVLVVDGHAPMLEVDVLTVGAAPAHDDRLGRVELLAGLLAVVGMDQLVPDVGVVEEALWGDAEDRHGAVAHMLETWVGYEAEPVADEVPSALDEEAEALVGGTEVAFGCLQPLVVRDPFGPVARAGHVCHPVP